MSAGLVGAAVGLVLAFAGAGAWAIIMQQLTIVVVGTVDHLGLDALAPALHLLDREPARPRRLQRQRARPAARYYVHRNADNLLIGRFLGAVGARRLRARLQRHAAADVPHRGAGAGGPVPGLLAHAGQPREDGRRVGARDAPRRRADGPGAVRPRRRRAGLRHRRARRSLVGRHPGDPGAELGRAPAVPAGAERRHAPGARSHDAPVPLLALLLRHAHDGVRLRHPLRRPRRRRAYAISSTSSSRSTRA